jgi:hypothetical protein
MSPAKAGSREIRDLRSPGLRPGLHSAAIFDGWLSDSPLTRKAPTSFARFSHAKLKIRRTSVVKLSVKTRKQLTTDLTTDL